jgi:hypothetical protein
MILHKHRINAAIPRLRLIVRARPAWQRRKPATSSMRRCSSARTVFASSRRRPTSSPPRPVTRREIVPISWVWVSPPSGTCFQPDRPLHDPSPPPVGSASHSSLGQPSFFPLPAARGAALVGALASACHSAPTETSGFRQRISSSHTRASARFSRPRLANTIVTPPSISPLGYPASVGRLVVLPGRRDYASASVRYPSAAIASQCSR